MASNCVRKIMKAEGKSLIEQVASILGKGKQKKIGYRWLTICPACQSDVPLLTLRDTEAGIKMTCRAGCPPLQINVWAQRLLRAEGVRIASQRKFHCVTSRRAKIAESLEGIKTHSAALVATSLDWLQWSLRELVEKIRG